MPRIFFWIMVLATVLLFGQSFADTLGADGATNEHAAHSLVLFLHQLLLVYWLGPDIAIFIWSRRAVDTTLGAEQRIVAGQMMTMIDIVPRVCLSLFLTVAGVLSDTYGLPHPWWQMIGIVLVGPVWLTLVLLGWLNRGSDFGALVARAEIWLRCALVIGIPLSVLWSVSTDRLAGSPWIGGKLVILALVILLGLIMRWRFRGFFDGMARLQSEGPSAAVDAQMLTSLARARPFGHAIWLLLLWASLMGIVKPGEQDPAPVAAAVVSSAVLEAATVADVR